MFNSDIKICAYATHYEVENYQLGDSPQLEKDLSYWREEKFQWYQYFFYREETKTLYIPRGYDDNKLSDFLRKPINYRDQCNNTKKFIFSMKLQPRNDIQREGIRFLIGKDEYHYTRSLSQLVLSFEGGGGKTYAAIAACSIYAKKVLVVAHSSIIRQQWVDRIQEYTNVPKTSIELFTSSKALHDLLLDKNKSTVNRIGFYIVSHSLLNNYMKTYGFDSLNILMDHLGIGVKIVDEVHREYENVYRLDYAMNVPKNIYLTATMAVSDRCANAIYQKCFDRVFKLKRSTSEAAVPCNLYYVTEMFSTHIDGISQAGLYTKGRIKKFSKIRYIEYELEKGDIVDYVIKWIDYCIKKNFLTKEDQFVVVSPKKESCDIFCKCIQEIFPEMKVCVHHSDSKVDSFDDYNIICVTASMISDGTDIDNLTGIILTEPMVSAVNNDQMIHRLKRGKNNKDRIFIDLVDWSVKPTVKMYKERRKTICGFVTKEIMINPFVKK